MNLTSPVTSLPFVGNAYSLRLKKLGIENLGDLILHKPVRYLDYRKHNLIKHLKSNELFTIRARVESSKNIFTKTGRIMQIVNVSDESGSIKVIWFNQPYLVRGFKKGMNVYFSGTLGFIGNSKAIISPEYEIAIEGKTPIHTGKLVAIYPETGGVTSKWLRSKISNLLFKIKDQITEFIPPDIKSKFTLIDLFKAYEEMHFPKDEIEVQNAIKRLSFDELLYLHLRSMHRKSDWKKNKSAFNLTINIEAMKQFITSLPFKLTLSQEKSIDEILKDLDKNVPMNRLLEGDVGSGKTVVAAAAAFTAFTNSTQVVLMAPTQILAQQHFVTLEKLLSKFKIRISLVTSAGIESDLGRSDVIVGTHALLHKKVSFDKVSLVIIDEQHRFGVEQRTHLIQKANKNTKIAPHVLTMTATPIPRTVALTFYGDLDLSVLTQMPKNRLPVKTWVVPPKKREDGYKWIDKEIENNKVQAFIVCPLIEESENETMKDVRAATVEFVKLTKIFPKRKLGLLHGKQKIKEKNEILSDFRNGKIDILVATPVVEVGIDIPNATIMVIEGADRFGLAALHQLRGRVGRGAKQSYCLLFANNQSKHIYTRLKAMEKSHSGIELAELDLKLRGPGEIFGFKQHGFPELKIASWQDFDLIKKTRDLAETIQQKPASFKSILDHFFPKTISPN